MIKYGDKRVPYRTKNKKHHGNSNNYQGFLWISCSLNSQKGGANDADTTGSSK